MFVFSRSKFVERAGLWLTIVSIVSIHFSENGQVAKPLPEAGSHG